MADLLLSPGLWLILGGLLFTITDRRAWLVLIVGAPLLALLGVWLTPFDAVWSVHFLGYELQPVRSTDTGRLFATVFSLMALAGGIFAWRIASTLELASAFIYAGSAVCVTFAGDLMTLFLFWELMALGSTLVLWAAGTEAARKASMRYLLLHLFGGMLLVVGIAGHAVASGSLLFEPMQADSLAHWLILAGFLLNAGAPPFSAWIADAYPEASPSGTVFLSAFTTKTAVFVLIMGFPGTWVLIPIGIYMIFYGIIYALLENDMRRILAYSIVNQVGFMVTGVGIGTEMALNGAAAHAFAHIIYKGLLLMSAGAVLHQTGKRLCTDLGGLFQSMPWTTLLGTIGALAISAFPFTSGFTTKSMIAQAAADQHLMYVWFALAAASAGVFLHAGIKFPWFVFFQKDSGLRPPDPPANMLVAMWLFAGLCIGLGVWAEPLYAMLAYPVTYHAYSAAHLVAQFQLLLFAGLAFFVMLPMMKRTLTITLDFDYFYRKFFMTAAAEFSTHGERTMARFAQHVDRQWQRLLASAFRHHGPQGVLARSWPTGSMVIWVAVMLGLSLALYYT